ncbi:hypothetical protein ACWGHA_19840 [Streptomyces xanthophaeus]
MTRDDLIDALKHASCERADPAQSPPVHGLPATDHGSQENR